MPFLGLNQGENALTTVRADSWQAVQYISVSPNPSVYTDQVDGDINLEIYAEIPLLNSGVTGDIADIRPGMTYIVRDFLTDAIKLVGRVRKTPDPQTLFIAQTSVNLGNNDTITVYNDYRVWSKLPRWDSANKEQLNDWDLTFLVPGPAINGVQSVYADFVDNVSGVLEIELAPDILQAKPGVAAFTYAWDIPAGITITSGTVASKDITIEAEPGFYYLNLDVTETTGQGSRTSTRHIAIFAHGDGFQPATGFNGASITADLDSGYNASLSAFDGIDDIIDNTLICVWSANQFYGTTETNVNGTIDFVGRLRTDTSGSAGDLRYATLKTDARFECEGPLAQLFRTQIENQPIITAKIGESPTRWGTLSELTFWRAVLYILAEYTTYVNVYGIGFDDTSLDYRFPDLSTNGGGGLYVTQDIGVSINAALEAAPDGVTRMVRDARISRGGTGIFTSGSWTLQDTFEVSIQREQVDTVGLVQASGGYFSPLDEAIGTVESRAPGSGPGAGEGTTTLARQVLLASEFQAAAQIELNDRAGAEFARENDATAISASLPDGYHYLVPSRATLHKWTLDSESNNRGYTTDDTESWLLLSISTDHDNNTGTRNVSASWAFIPDFTPGNTYIRPTVPETITTGGSTSQPYIPPPNPPGPITPPPLIFPESGGTTSPGSEVPLTASLNGDTVVLWSGDGAWLSTDYLRTSPTYTDITPALGDGENVAQIIPNVTAGDFAALMLTASSEESRVWRTENILEPGGGWTAGQAYSGIYDQLVVTDTGTDVYMKAFDNGQTTTFCQEWDFTLGPQEWVILQGVYPGPETGGIDGRDIELTLAFSGPRVLTKFSITVDGSGGGGSVQLFATVQGSGEQLLQSFSASNGVKEWTGSVANVVSLRALGDRDFVFGFVAARMEGEGTNPVGVNTCTATVGAAAYRYSDDTGATFSAPVPLGPVFGGFSGIDAIKIGDSVLFGTQGQTSIVDSPGGSLATYGDPMPTGSNPGMLIVPRIAFDNVTDNIDTTTPDYYVFSATPETGGDEATLWAVDTGGTNFVNSTPNDGANDATAISSNCMAVGYDDSSVIAVIGNIGGTRTLLYSTSQGSTWIDRGNLGAFADYPRFLRLETGQTKQLFWVDTDPYYSPDGGVTQTQKTNPFDGPLTGIQPFG